jgi:hypothetical protein
MFWLATGIRDFFPIQSATHWLSGPTRLLFKWYRWAFPGGKAAGVSRTIHLLLASMLSINNFPPTCLHNAHRVKVASYWVNSTGNATQRGVRLMIVAGEKDKHYIFWVCVCILSYPARTLLHCHRWPSLIFRIFPHYLINGMIFGKKCYLV